MQAPPIFEPVPEDLDSARCRLDSKTFEQLGVAFGQWIWLAKSNTEACANTVVALTMRILNDCVVDPGMSSGWPFGWQVHSGGFFDFYGRPRLVNHIHFLAVTSGAHGRCRLSLQGRQSIAT